MSDAFDLGKHLSVEDVAERFELPVQKVETIVEEERQQVSLEISIRETEARNYIRAVYEREIKKFGVCQAKECAHRDFANIVQALAHVRLHLMLEARDQRVVRDVAKDIHAELFPTVEKKATFGGALTPEERARLIAEMQSRGLIDGANPRLLSQIEDNPPSSD